MEEKKPKKEIRVGIIGGGSAGIKVLMELEKHGFDPFIIPVNDNTINILGTSYEEIKQVDATFNKKLFIPIGYDFDDKKERAHPKVDLVTEFKLIQQKQSNLSKWERDWVVLEFNKRFKKI